MSAGLVFHRAMMIVFAPIVWTMATLFYAVCAPLSAAEDVFLAFKKHWNDQ